MSKCLHDNTVYHGMGIWSCACGEEFGQSSHNDLLFNRKDRRIAELEEDTRIMNLRAKHDQNRIALLEKDLADALASFRCTQRIEDYPADHWSNRAAGYLQEPTP